MDRKTFELLSEGQKWDLLQAIDFMTLKNLRVQLFRNFKKGWQLPEDQFRDGTCYEYAKGDFYFKKFKETGEDQYLNLFFATLARHKNNFCNSEKDVKNNLRKIGRVPVHVKLTTLCYFGCIKEMISELYGEFLFKSNLVGSSEGYTPKLNLEWWGVFNSVAESGVFGSISDVYKSNFHDVCTYLVQKKEEYLVAKSSQNES